MILVISKVSLQWVNLKNYVVLFVALTFVLQSCATSAETPAFGSCIEALILFFKT